MLFRSRNKLSCEIARPDCHVKGEEKQYLSDAEILVELDGAESSATEKPNVGLEGTQDTAHMRFEERFDTSKPPPIPFASKPRPR